MFAFAIVPLTALLAAAPAPSQEGNWFAWHGCWRSAGDDAAERVVCLVPGARSGEVQLNVIAGGAIAERATIRTDGVPYDVEEGGCKGTEVARWSSDGQRVMLRAELDCEGTQRVSSGVLAMVSGYEWVDVQSISVAGQQGTRTVRYRSIPSTDMPAEITAALDETRHLAREAARMQASAPLDMEDVIEATSQLPRTAVEALIAVRKNTFELNAAKLAQLRDAGVPRGVIDMMVAVSYPKAFAVRPVQPTGYAEQPAERYVDRPLFGRYSCYDPYWDLRRTRFGYSRYGYNSCYDYDYGYGWYSRYGYRNGYGWYDGPVVVIVRPDDDQQGSSSGQVIKGQGYTRGGTSSSGTAVRRGESGSGTTSTTSAGSTSGTSSTGTTSTSGGSSSSGRTAIPRGSGGGGGS